MALESNYYNEFKRFLLWARNYVIEHDCSNNEKCVDLYGSLTKIEWMQHILEQASLTFTDDFMFCAVLQENEDLCRGLLELILDVKVKGIVRTEKQKSIELTADGKGVRFDVYLEDEANTVYDIEMQTSSDPDLAKRSRYYQGMIDLNLIGRGARYS